LLAESVFLAQDEVDASSVLLAFHIDLSIFGYVDLAAIGSSTVEAEPELRVASGLTAAAIHLVLRRGFFQIQTTEDLLESVFPE
jgi:hypothetical protein